MSAEFSPPTKADRETIYAKIRFLSTIMGQMDKMIDDGVLDGKDFYAMSMFLNDVGEEVYPEWKEI